MGKGEKIGLVGGEKKGRAKCLHRGKKGGKSKVIKKKKRGCRKVDPKKSRGGDYLRGGGEKKGKGITEKKRAPTRLRRNRSNGGGEKDVPSRGKVKNPLGKEKEKKRPTMSGGGKKRLTGKFCGGSGKRIRRKALLHGKEGGGWNPWGSFKRGEQSVF